MNPASDKVSSVRVWRRSHKPGMDVYANNREEERAGQLLSLSLPPQRASPEGSLSSLKAPSVIPNIAVSSLEIIASSCRFDYACGAGKMHSVCLRMSSNSISKKINLSSLCKFTSQIYILLFTTLQASLQIDFWEWCSHRLQYSKRPN